MANPSPPPLSFRVATPEDLGILHPLVESAYRGDESRLGWTTEADLLTGVRIDAAGLLAKITQPDGAILLVTTTTEEETNDGTADPEKQQREALIACCEVALHDPQTAYFGLFAVSPRRQGGGVGRAVLAHAEAYVRRAWPAAERLEMRVLASRAELIAWYARRGYRGTGAELPFPLHELEKTGSAALVDDLRFVVLEKDLRQAVSGGEATGLL